MVFRGTLKSFSLVKDLISFLLREGLQLQRLVREERHGQMEVVIPQLPQRVFQILMT